MLERSDITTSNSLADLAARIRAEHQATAAALTSSVEHAMTAGDLLLEAKAQVNHGQWLPWLTERCAMSERTAQLYMRIAKNRATIEMNIRNGVADLTLGQAAALMMMTADIKKLLDFARQAEAIDDPEQLMNLCIEKGVGYIHDPNYNMFAGRTEQEIWEWHLFLLFLVQHYGALVDGGVAGHIEWILQRPFQNVAEWLGPEGDKFRERSCMRSVGSKVKDDWSAFVAERASLTILDIIAELDRIHAYQQANPRPVRERRRAASRKRRASAAE
jgi:hypothetical protein